MRNLVKYFVFMEDGRTFDVMAYDGYDAKTQVMNITLGRGRINAIWRA